MYYGADDKLALANLHGGISAVSDDSRPGAREVWEMHRYDALGRRVMTHAVRGSSCPASSAECASVVERTVWDGGQIFYEIRTPDTTPANDQPAGGTYNAYGRVAYLHAGAIDAPLAVTRMELSGQPAEVTVAPHAGWQGSYVGGSLMNGTSQEGCTGASGCPLIDWPGAKQTADGLPINPPSNAWWGRLINEQLDGSGLKYQRNRFYDPTTGQFTQADPIGLSGGVNLYAFAGGDPVNFRDPYGLCPPCAGSGLLVPGLAGPAIGATGATSAATQRLESNQAIANTIAAAFDALRDKLQVKFVTYTRTGPHGEVYSGRTSGRGDPQAIANARSAGHDSRLAGFGAPVVDQWATGFEGRAAIRGREQQLIDHYGGARSEGGTSANLIRGVSRSNPLAGYYDATASMMFGKLPPRR